MALLIKAEELKGLISIPEAVAAVRAGFRDQGEKPAYSAPRIRIQHEDRRVSVHQGGCHSLEVAGMFIHVERFTFKGGAQQYEKAGKRVYVAYDSETAELKAIIVGSLPLFEEPAEDWFGTETPITGAVGTDILARPDCRVLGLYGTGRQARRHLVTMCTIRPSIQEVRVFSRSAANRAAFVARMQPQVRARLTRSREAGRRRPRRRSDLPRHRQQRAGAVRRLARARPARDLDRCQQQGCVPARFGIAAAARIRRRRDRARRPRGRHPEGTGDHGRAG